MRAEVDGSDYLVPEQVGLSYGHFDQFLHLSAYLSFSSGTETLNTANLNMLSCG